MAELKPIGVLFSAGDFSQGVGELWRLWDRIPEPKTATLNAYLAIEYGVAFALKLNDLEEAQKWAALAPPFAPVRQDMGEVEFLVGKVAFECGQLDLAKEKFLTANAKSKGRAFQGKDAKYRQLLN